MSQNNTWAEDWQVRLKIVLSEIGFSDGAISFAKANPQKTYDELVESLHKSITPIQLIWVLTDEAISKNQITWFVKDSLVREIREKCNQGWNVGSKSDFKIASVVGSWIASVEPLGKNVVKLADQAWDQLKAKAQTGWLPTDINDPIIEQVFDGLSFNTAILSRI